MIEKLNKKSLLYLGIIIIAAIVVSMGLFYYRSLISEPEIDDGAFEELKRAKRERIIKQQLEELEELKAEIPPLPEEEIQKQLEELEELKAEIPPLPEEEIQKQLEELNK